MDCDDTVVVDMTMVMMVVMFVMMMMMMMMMMMTTMMKGYQDRFVEAIMIPALFGVPGSNLVFNTI